MDRLTRSMQTVESHMSPFQLLIQYDVVRIEQHMVVTLYSRGEARKLHN